MPLSTGSLVGSCTNNSTVRVLEELHASILTVVDFVDYASSGGEQVHSLMFKARIGQVLDYYINPCNKF